MLTTEVVKGLISGKVYRRNICIPLNTWQEIKVRDRLFFTRSDAKTEWVTGTFMPSHLEAHWEEVVEWQEIGWKEAVDCEEKSIPLQFFSNIVSEWIDSEKPFKICSFSFVRDSKWRKKVEVASD